MHLTREYPNGQYIYKKVPTLISSQENADRKYNAIKSAPAPTKRYK